MLCDLTSKDGVPDNLMLGEGTLLMGCLSHG